MPDQGADPIGDEIYRLPSGDSLVSAAAAPPALAQPSETGIGTSVSEREAGSELEGTGSLAGELSSLRRRLVEQERMLRGIQSRYDRETARLHQQLKEQRRPATEDIASQMQSAGAEASQVAAFRRARAQEDMMEELGQQANGSHVPPAPLAGHPAAQRYVREMCEAADVDPTDQRLDLSTPNTFRASLHQIKAERGKKTDQRTQIAEPKVQTTEQRTQSTEEEGKPKERERRSARLDLDVLGGGGGGAIHELPDDLDELWKLAKRETPSLRGK